jgi:hypothetical protein
MHPVLLLFAFLVCCPAAEPPQISLMTPQGELKPDCRWIGPSPVIADGSILLAVDDAEVVATDANTGNRLWMAREPNGRLLKPLLVNDHHLLVCRLPKRLPSANKREWDFTGCAEVLRIDTHSGDWATPIADTANPNDQVVVSSIISAADRIDISRHHWEREQTWDSFIQTDLEVTVLAKSQVLWTRRWPCMPPVPEPGAFLLSDWQPTSAPDSICPCLAWEDAFIICPGPTSTIYCVNATDGKVRWSVDRIWEFDRDFIGPSVWCHIMRRFGRDEVDEAFHRAGTKTVNVTPGDKALVDAQIPLVLAEWRKAFNHDHLAWLCGGPWRVSRPHDEFGRKQSDAILISVAIAPQHPFAGNLARIRIFDIGEGGEVVAMADLSRPIRQAQALNEMLTFTSLPLGAGALRPFAYSRPVGGIGGGPDCLLSMAWYEEPEDSITDAWLQGSWKPSGAMGDHCVVQPKDGGVIKNADDTSLTENLDLISLIDGSQRRCILKVPIGEKVRFPTENYSTFTRPDGSRGAVSFNSFSSDLPTQFTILGDRLIVTIGTSRRLAFTIPSGN